MFTYRLKRILGSSFTNNDNMKYYIINGILFTLMASFSKSYAMKFLFRIGGTEYHASLFNALPGFVAAFAAIPGILWLNRSKNRKSTMGILFLGSRLFTLSFAFIPFLPLYYQPIIFVLITALMNFPESISINALQSFAGDIFPPQERATAISLRNKFSTLAQLASFLILGQALSRISSSESFIIRQYQIFFVIAFIIGIFEIKSFYKLKENSCSTPKISTSFTASVSTLIANKKFMIFLTCSLLFHFGWQMGWPLFSIYQIKYLGADEWWLTILNLTSSITMFFTYTYWSKMIKNKGNAYVIMIATLGMSITPILYVLSPNLQLLVLSGLVMGFFTSGTTTVVLSSLLDAIPEENRLLYVSVHATFTSITLAIAPLVGNSILSTYNIYIALLATTGFRLIGSLSFFIRNITIAKSNSKGSIGKNI
jgi:MFS family permease